MPGDCISADHYFSPVQGPLPHTFGKECQGYACGSLFVDHASGNIFNFPQYSNTAHKTLQSINRLEAMAREEGFKIKRYHSDNGIFATADFKAHCEHSQQTFSFSGIGTKLQNSIAEGNIKTIAQWACANMLHLATYWPQHADSKFWPQATDYAVWVFNRFPSLDSGIAPNELWPSVHAYGTNMTMAHVFDCPVYVLDASLQDGKKIPKWNPQTHLGLFLGFSNLHLSQVPLVLNVATGHISPQFHVIFDKFETMHSLPANEPLNTQWAQILHLGHECYLDIDYDKNDDPILPSLFNIIKLYSDTKAMKPPYDPTPHIEFDACDKYVVPPHASIKPAHLPPIKTPHNPPKALPQNLPLPLPPKIPLPLPPQGDWHCPTSLLLAAPGRDNPINGYEGNAVSGGALQSSLTECGNLQGWPS
jgi:hypothetical protein